MIINLVFTNQNANIFYTLVLGLYHPPITKRDIPFICFSDHLHITTFGLTQKNQEGLAQLLKGNLTLPYAKQPSQNLYPYFRQNKKM